MFTDKNVETIKRWIEQVDASLGCTTEVLKGAEIGTLKYSSTYHDLIRETAKKGAYERCLYANEMKRVDAIDLVKSWAQACEDFLEVIEDKLRSKLNISDHLSLHSSCITARVESKVYRKCLDLVVKKGESK